MHFWNTLSTSGVGEQRLVEYSAKLAIFYPRMVAGGIALALINGYPALFDAEVKVNGH